MPLLQIQKINPKAMLALVQRRGRYVVLPIAAGGRIPADVATTWFRVFGDRKFGCVGLSGEAECVRHADEARWRNYLRFSVPRGA
jgi:hypothetical protein